jgi:protein N-terminal methyltransferase
MEISGEEVPDEVYKREWQYALASGEKLWYDGAVEYWSKQDRSINGVLGGYAVLHAPDIADSSAFLDGLSTLEDPPEMGTVVDCGAGMGRVTKAVLLPRFQKVDLVEPVANLLDEAKELMKKEPRAERYLLVGLQDFSPESGRYDVIWNQWCCLYLTDDDLVEYLQRCKAALRSHGVICCKENVVIDGVHVFDYDDNSVTRTDQQYKDIFARAGLQVARERRQTDWPSDMFPVMTYALR